MRRREAARRQLAISSRPKRPTCGGTTSGARASGAASSPSLAGDEVYGIEILSIREIIKLREITEVPRAPRFLLGVVDGARAGAAGASICACGCGSTRRRSSARRASSWSCTRASAIGLLVDEVRGVVRFADDQIEPPPPSLAPSEAPFLAGIGRYPTGARSAW